jgi:transcription antitermination factor NusG
MADSNNRLTSKLLESYKDQMVELGAQNEEQSDGAEKAKDHKEGRQKKRSNRSRRVTGKARQAYTAGVQENQEKHDRYFYKVEDGSLRARVGVHGGGEPRWWALRVTVGREKQTCTAIERRYQQLCEAAALEGDDESLQEIETWDIWKRVRAWNPKTEKMGNKMIRYEGGGWVLLRAIMDTRIASVLKGNINILGFQHREVFEGEEFPKPVESELVDELVAWQEDLEDITEEQVREELGLPAPAVSFEYDDYDDLPRRREDRYSEKNDSRKSRNKYEDLPSGLFSRNDDSWDEGSSSWYGGTSSDGSLSSSFRDDEPSDDDNLNEFGAWLGDFTGSSSNDEWDVSAMEDGSGSSSSKTIPSAQDDLSWWDDMDSKTIDVANDGDGLVDASDSGVAGEQDEKSTHFFTDDELDTWSLDEGEHIFSHGTPIEVISGSFKDFEGIVLEEIEGSDKIKVEVDVFGKPTVVELLRSDVKI